MKCKEGSLLGDFSAGPVSTGRIILLVFTLLVTASAQATVISYSTANVQNDTWQYDYRITNDSLVQGISEFTIFFESALYADIALISVPALWDAVVAQPDSGLPDDGFIDLLDLFAGPIGLGSELTGLSVQFRWLGSGQPSTQRFDVIDPNDFQVLESGNTQPHDIGVVPEPPITLLCLTALLAIPLVSVLDRPRNK